MSRSLATNAGSLDSLKVRTRCGRSLCARQIRSTELGLIPTISAMAAAVQWVASRGGSVAVNSTTRSMMACARGGMRGGRVLSRSEPATPSGHALADEPLPPAPDARLALAGPPHDFGGAVAVRRGQDDPRPPDVLLRAVPVRHDRLQTGTVLGGQLDPDPFAHPRDVGMPVAEGNPPLDAIHSRAP